MFDAPIYIWVQNMAFRIVIGITRRVGSYQAPQAALDTLPPSDYNLSHSLPGEKDHAAPHSLTHSLTHSINQSIEFSFQF